MQKTCIDSSFVIEDNQLEVNFQDMRDGLFGTVLEATGVRLDQLLGTSPVAATAAASSVSASASGCRATGNA